MHRKPYKLSSSEFKTRNGMCEVGPSVAQQSAALNVQRSQSLKMALSDIWGNPSQGIPPGARNSQISIPVGSIWGKYSEKVCAYHHLLSKNMNFKFHVVTFKFNRVNAPQPLVSVPLGLLFWGEEFAPKTFPSSLFLCRDSDSRETASSLWCPYHWKNVASPSPQAL